MVKIEKENLGMKPQRVVRRFKLSCGKSNKVAFVLSDKVRTHYQQVLIVLEGMKISEVRILKFDEPIKYKSPLKWLAYKFKNKNAKELNVDAISGATLTTSSILRTIKKAWVLSKL